MQSKFESEKSGIYKRLFLFGLIPIFLLLIVQGTLHWHTTINFFFGLAVILFIIGLCLWFWNGTVYNITDTSLIVNFGPFKWTIPVKEITAIRLNQKPAGLWSASLSFKGMVIYYKKTMIYISPKQQEYFLTKLRGLNENIQIKGEI